MDVEPKNKRYHSFNTLIREKKKKGRLWAGSYILFALIFLAAWILLKSDTFDVFGKHKALLQRLALGLFFVNVILFISKIIELIILKKAHTRSGQYNLLRLLKLVTVMFIAGVFISVLFVNWYAAAVSLGLISLILGFALQGPISSFIGWIYILIRSPFRIGDRIQVGTFKGDVVEISYLDTTLWEFGGDYLTNDLPSGRLIRFPNSMVLQTEVYNYSWQKFPFIWNEIPFHISYESDLNFVQKTIREITMQELGEEMSDRINRFKELIENVPVDDLTIKEYPFVNYRTNNNTWVEASLTYLVDPKQASVTRTRLIKKIMAEFMKNPDQVIFPKANLR
jgi:small-conductance mechanosensitive channel